MATNNPLRVSLENIIPLTEARDHFSQIVNEVQRDKLYVLTKGGKPAVAIIDVKYLETISGGEINDTKVKEEIKKDPTKVGLPQMIPHAPIPPAPPASPPPMPSPPPPAPKPVEPPKPVPTGPMIETSFNDHNNNFKTNEPLKTPPIEETHNSPPVPKQNPAEPIKVNVNQNINNNPSSEPDDMVID